MIVCDVARVGLEMYQSWCGHDSALPASFGLNKDIGLKCSHECHLY